jgi:D-sedoheptulose 7-phosphate isomerase
MDDFEDLLQARFADHVDTVYRSLDSLYPLIHAASDIICEALLAERPLIVCGSALTTGLAQIFCTSLLCNAQMERPALPVILVGNDAAACSAVMQNHGPSELLARQVQALAQPGDVVLLVCGPGGGMGAAARAAHARQARVIALSAEAMADTAGLSQDNDVDLRIPSDTPARVLECQLLLLDCLAEIIEHRLFGAA